MIKLRKSRSFRKAVEQLGIARYISIQSAEDIVSNMNIMYNSIWVHVYMCSQREKSMGRSNNGLSLGCVISRIICHSFHVFLGNWSKSNLISKALKEMTRHQLNTLSRTD